eukprot:CAMPEP_0113552534 /NCGR_PEP_ID=MMETSP0015_2-20120614/15119_1 /TAXON_ID=2838 /ORGANISM="Odontella" /LENGTH=221 /DNA_ID=CAMNT_0000453519 /DNA_START=157 /DNA_END=819 /DNA_ORIENTATION=- /assembly_acc=CAM_ASM_000160
MAGHWHRSDALRRLGAFAGTAAGTRRGGVVRPRSLSGVMATSTLAMAATRPLSTAKGAVLLPKMSPIPRNGRYDRNLQQRGLVPRRNFHARCRAEAAATAAKDDDKTKLLLRRVSVPRGGGCEATHDGGNSTAAAKRSLETMKTTTMIFAVEGMRCGGCAAAVRKALLGSSPGVKRAAVNLVTETAAVEFDSASHRPDDEEAGGGGPHPEAVEAALAAAAS